MSTKSLRKINELITIFETAIDYESCMISNWLKGLSSSDDKLQCIKSIRSYTSLPELVQKLIDIHNALPNILQFIKQNNNAFELLCSGYFRQLNIKSIISMDIINMINAFCIVDCIATSEQTKCVIDYGGVPVLIETFKKSSSLQIKSSTIWALGNIAGDCTEFRDLLLNYNILDHILKCVENIDIQHLNEYNLALCQNIAWSVSNYCRGIQPPSYKFVEIALKICSIMIKANDDDILHDVAWTLNYVTKKNHNDDDDDECIQRIQLIIDNGFLPYLSKILQHQLPKMPNCALRVIGNIMITGTCEQQKSVINTGILKSFSNLLAGNISIIKSVICWIVTNIAASDTDNIITYDLVAALVGCLRIENMEYSKGAMCAVSNIIGKASNEQISCYVNHGVIAGIFVFIQNVQQRFNQSLEQYLIWALVAIEQILMNGNSVFSGRNLYVQYVQDCNGVDVLQSLQANDTIPFAIYRRIEDIINAYFNN